MKKETKVTLDVRLQYKKDVKRTARLRIRYEIVFFCRAMRFYSVCDSSARATLWRGQRRVFLKSVPGGPRFETLNCKHF